MAPLTRFDLMAQSSDLDASPEPAPAPLLRSVLSLLIFVHCFCVLVVLASTFRRSTLQARLVGIFGPYTQLLHFDPGLFTPFHHTHGFPADDDAIIAVDLYASGELPVERQPRLKTVTLPAAGSSWLGSRQRSLRLAKRLAAYADPDDEREDLSSGLARAIGSRILREHDAQRAVVRCLRRSSQPLDLATLYEGFPPDDPTAAPYDSLLYEADVWIDEDGEAQVQRRVAQAEAAPRRVVPAP
ncbi:MAG: hypothetical protein WD872_15790 [Pirellulaceae bacterium]